MKKEPSPLRDLPGTLVVQAPAKVNLYLRVLGVRPDGYHEIDTVIVPLDLADTLEIHAASDPGGFRTLSFALDVRGEPALTRGVPVDESNLVIRAAKALADRLGVRGFADISLEKRIPAAAGLGGGSSDAAAVLRGLDLLWGAALDEAALREIGAEVGSDVPALLAGRPVRARGRGELVDPVNVAARRWVLVTFPFGVSTADAYRWWDSDPGRTGPDPGPILRAAEHGDVAALLSNDLEAPVVRRRPDVREAKEVLLAGGAEGAVMCGSGPTIAGILPSDRETLDSGAESELLRISGSFPIYAPSRPDGGR